MRNPRSSPVGVAGLSSARQRKIKRSAFIYFRLRPDVAAMPLDNALHDGQANSGAFKGLDRVQTLKNAKELARVLHVKARAIVANKTNLPTVFDHAAHFDDCG